MIFTSIVFLLFFSFVVIMYYLLPHNWQWIWLLLSGIVFYMYSNPVYILIPVIIILISFYAGLLIGKVSMFKINKPTYLAAIIFIAGILVFFKYSNFFTTNLFTIINFFRNKFFHLRYIPADPFLIKVIAPLGLSYITFQAIGYLIEIKRGNHLPEKNLGHFATFILFFPKLIAGPVERAHNFLPQIKKPIVFDYNNISIGFKLIIWGFFKKLVIADRLSIYVNAVFDNAGQHNSITLIVAALFYVFQIYADFSGYTDMALGFAKVLGYTLLPNFNRPLFAKSITEFWRKWHISLSTWFADYFYNPIAIAKRDWGNWSIVYAFFITFIVLGFWHGANWTFIVFGALQGLALTVEFFTRKFRKKIRKNVSPIINTIAGIGFTISYFAFSLIYFTADSLTAANLIIARIFTVGGPLYIGTPSVILFSVAGILFLMMVEFKKEFYNDLFTISNNQNWIIRNCFYSLLLIMILIAGVFDGGEFIYFQF